MLEKLLVLVILILPIISSLISWMIGNKSEELRDRFNISITGISFIFITLLYKSVSQHPIEIYIPDVMGVGLYLKLDMFRYIFIWITSFIWFLTTIYSTQYLIRYKNRNRYYAFFILTLGSTIGIFLSENLLNLFTFFEIMSFTSYLLVIHDEDEYAHDAGRTYIMMAIAGGLVLLMGLFLLYDYTGTLNIKELSLRITYIGNIKYLIVTLIIIGFGVKASMVPLHIWLPKAYPAAPTPATAVLSGILVKTGIFGIILVVFVIMSGDFILSTALIIIGFANMFIGGFLALFQRNIKRILAYSSMSQVGYILVGMGLMGILGDHNLAALYGTLYHIINHAFFKVLLFLCAGVIYMTTHDLSINFVRGFGKHMHLLKILFFIGLLATIGMPGFNGFISKSLLHEALAEAHHMYPSKWFTFAEYVFTISSSFTVAYLLKIFYGVFLEENEKHHEHYKEHLKNRSTIPIRERLRKRAIFPMIILSAVIIVIGLKPGIFMRTFEIIARGFNIHETIDYNFYTTNNMKSSFIVIILGVLIFLFIIMKFLRVEGKDGPMYINPSLKWFNLENHFYIPVGKFLYYVSSAIFHVIDRGVINSITYISNGIKRISGVKVKKPVILRQGIQIRKHDIKPSILSNIEIPENIKMSIHESIHENVIKEQHVTFSELLTSLRERLNSLVYAVFIFAIMIIVILITLVF